MLIYYLIGIGLFKFIASTSRVGEFLIFLRCVDKKDKGILMGIFIWILSVFVFIPTPIFYGAVIDSTCMVWKSVCGENGNCLLYHTDKFRYLIHILPSGFMLLASLFDFGVYLQVKKLDLYKDGQKIDLTSAF